ncbi:hypothetical protein Scep_011251 [Stephania cephalantha]|uniref:Transmembrane protein n=1 Tax=Stephania cephalantha TaxID=152367 RepID=A0AAP0P5P4_9MAGN
MASKLVKAITFIVILLFVCLLAADAAEVTANDHRSVCKRRMGLCSHYHNCYSYCSYFSSLVDCANFDLNYSNEADKEIVHQQQPKHQPKEEDKMKKTFTSAVLRSAYCWFCWVGEVISLQRMVILLAPFAGLVRNPLCGCFILRDIFWMH